MIAGFAVLLVLQLVGEVISRGLGLPVPGPVIGMALLVAGLALFARFGRADPAEPGAPVGRVADGLLSVLSLLFVPAGVGVVQYLDLLAAEGIAVVGTLIVSTFVTLVATVVTFRLIARATGAGADEEAMP